LGNNCLGQFSVIQWHGKQTTIGHHLEALGAGWAADRQASIGHHLEALGGRKITIGHHLEAMGQIDWQASIGHYLEALGAGWARSAGQHRATP
jgi:hypothetical protein